MSFTPDEIYHICQRGVDGKTIFPNNDYYRRFLLGMAVFNSPASKELRFERNTDMQCPSDEERLVDILAYILRLNHFHILLKCREPEGATIYTRKLFGSHTKYFNIRNSRKGVLFQGRTVVKHIDSDAYLQHVVNYIHLNALDDNNPEWRENGIKNIKKAGTELLKYQWSSLGSIIGKRDNPILSYIKIENIFDVDDLLNSALRWSAEDYFEHKDFWMED